MNIKQMPESDRPREKLLNHGPETLTDAELISLILSYGGKGLSALEIAQKLIGESGSVKNLLRQSVQNLVKNRFLGIVKAARICAVREIVNRYKNDAYSKIKISKPADAYNILKSDIYGKEKEHLFLITLNSRNLIIRKELLSVGTVNETLMHPREIIKSAVAVNAVSIILAHNHPSGEPYPSDEDIAITKTVFNACKTVGIKMIDHLIVCDSSFTSMRSQNLLEGGDNNC